MGNLFRCPINGKQKEYILKAGGILQSKYPLTPLIDYVGGNSKLEYGNNWVKSTYYGWAGIAFEFNATGWNKLFVGQAHEIRNYVYAPTWLGITTNIKSAMDAFSTMSPRLQVDTTLADHIIDISNMSGKMYLVMAVNVDVEVQSAYREGRIEGDVYLSK